ncbi:ClpP/crotonase [Fomitiporia mediterranea MF3/22]|uniref:ClpP/crotonase n=1 Tax=Fomitiporia mediterranea (strain MF3/22) TaxID=694068 RepID=UPI0004409C70|nr:ClpP/crotonase [Fomitiporia mediterranea MF3/22]EJD06026.1 ClpP/crotonase [Fomitiporia mediterranea MF3/22]
MSTLTSSISDGIATLTFNRPRTLNAITREDYTALAEKLREIDAREDVVITLLQGKWFCSGTDVKTRNNNQEEMVTIRENFLGRVARPNTDCSRALYTHSKILVAALNGPVMAFLGHFDFIYCMPDVWLSVPFSFVGIISEAGSSVSFVNRMGLSKANEALIFGKKMEADELLACGFVNKIFPKQSLLQHLLEQLEGLDPTAVLKIKELIQYGINEKNSKDGTNLRESYAQAERFASGTPTQRFLQIATKQIKHKL